MDTTAIPHGSIVVGVDDSPAGERAATWGAEQAAREHRPLVLVHATGSLGTPGTVWLTESDHVVQEMAAQGHRILAAVSEHVARRHPSLEVHPVVVADEAQRALLASAVGARLLVVGSRGRGPIRGRLLGSVSADVVRHAECPVVVVRPHHPGAVRRGVLVGVDGTERSSAPIEFAYREASTRGLPLEVVHCVGTPVPEDARLRVSEAVAGMAEKYPDVHVTTTVRTGLPDPCLVAAAECMDLVVVGHHRAGAVSRVLAGDIGLHLVEHAHTVVALVPETSGPTHPAEGDLVP